MMGQREVGQGQFFYAFDLTTRHERFRSVLTALNLLPSTQCSTLSPSLAPDIVR